MQNVIFMRGTRLNVCPVRKQIKALFISFQSNPMIESQVSVMLVRSSLTKDACFRKYFGIIRLCFVFRISISAESNHVETD